MSNPVPLPDAWVERIWREMRNTWGADFDRKWSCPVGANPVEHVASLRGHWARELAVYGGRPGSIKHALDNLPAHPCNLVEFRDLCNRAPSPPPAASTEPAPQADAQHVAEVLGKLRSPASQGQQGARDWIQRARQAERNGKRLSLFAREAWRSALGVAKDEPA